MPTVVWTTCHAPSMPGPDRRPPSRVPASGSRSTLEMVGRRPARDRPMLRAATCIAVTSLARSLRRLGTTMPSDGDHVGSRADRHRHRAGAQAHLLDGRGVVVAEHPGELAAQRARLVDRVRRDPRQVGRAPPPGRRPERGPGAPCRRRWRASAAASRSCSPPGPRRARRAGRGRAPRFRRARRGARWPASLRRGRGGTARPAAAGPVCTGASRPTSHRRRPTTYSPACVRLSAPQATSSPTSRCAVGTGSSARAGELGSATGCGARRRTRRAAPAPGS